MTPLRRINSVHGKETTIRISSFDLTSIIRFVESVRSKLAPTFRGRQRYICCHSATLSGNFAPNSLGAVRECIAREAPRVEVDVRFMADDAMLIFHDSTLEPSTTGSGRVDALCAPDVANIRYKGDPRSGLCFLEHVVEALAGSSTMLQVDLKLMRPITDGQARKLEAALAPLEDRLIVGAQAHWNLRAVRGLPIAFDPTLHWCYEPDADQVRPQALGVHGLWDDSPIAVNERFSAAEYVEQRILDIRGILPNAIEWMVDIATILRLGELGVALGERLRSEGCALAAWTLRDTRPEMAATVERLFALGVETIITDSPLATSELVGAASS